MATRKLDRLIADPALRERRTISDYVSEALRIAIFNGEFADGEELNQVELAAHFGVSRVPIREALSRLQAEGLVTAEAHRRAVVQGYTPERISEIFDVRALLEGYMLERAAPNLSEGDLRRLTEICDALDRVGDHDEWLRGNAEFHQALLGPSGSVTSRAIVQQLSGQVKRYLRRTGGFDRAGEANAEHRLIIAALQDGNVHDAVACLRRHITTTGDVIRARLEATSGRVAEPKATPADARRRPRPGRDGASAA